MSNEVSNEELRFQDLMVDAMVRLIMASDGIGEREVLELMGRASTAIKINRTEHQAVAGAPASSPQPIPLRRGVGVMVINEQGRVFVGQRNDVAREAWQMPQGGVEPNETFREAALRELREETGIQRVEILSETKEALSYELPHELLERLPPLQWRGQLQSWFLMRFLGTDAEINVATEHPEFSNWKWAPHGALLGMIVPFKRNVYKRVIEEFAPYLIRIADANLEH